MKKCLIAVFLLCSSWSFACDLSQFTLTSIAGSGPYTITTRLCIGHGVRGRSTGGSPTGRFVFSFFDSLPITINSFTPDSVTGPATSVLFTGDTIGSQSSPLSSQQNIEYSTTVANGRYGCNSGNTCGTLTQTCINFVFTTNILPDSIRVFGIEASDSFDRVYGCNNQSDMMLDFTSVLPVKWHGFEAKNLTTGQNYLKWTIGEEENCNYYVVRRTEILDHHPHWDELDEQPCNNLSEILTYTYIDENPPAVSHYQIKQYDYNWESSTSQIVTVFNKGAQVQLYPNPASNLLTVFTKGAQHLKIYGSQGEVLLNKPIKAEEKVVLNMSQFETGVYFVVLEYSAERISSKLLISE